MDNKWIIRRIGFTDEVGSFSNRLDAEEYVRAHQDCEACGWNAAKDCWEAIEKDSTVDGLKKEQTVQEKLSAASTLHEKWKSFSANKKRYCIIGAISVVFVLICIIVFSGGPSGMWYNNEKYSDFMSLEANGEVVGFLETKYDGTVGAGTSDARWTEANGTVTIAYKSDGGHEYHLSLSYGKDSRGNETLINIETGHKYYRTKTLALE